MRKSSSINVSVQFNLAHPSSGVHFPGSGSLGTVRLGFASGRDASRVGLGLAASLHRPLGP